MLACRLNKLHVEDVNDVGLPFTNFELFHERLQENLHRDGLETTKYFLEATQHVLPKLNDLVVLNKHESYLFVEDGGEGVLLTGEVVQQSEQFLKETKP